MTQHTLRGTIILDACFLKCLEELDAHCRKKLNPPKTPEERPLGLLNRLAESGCRLVIPNEVMKEMFRVEEGRIGLEIAQDGRASFDIDLLNDSPYLPVLRDFITKQQAQGTLHCFGTVEAFNKAAASGKLSGGISIVNDWQRSDSPGYEPLFRDKTPDRYRYGEIRQQSHGDDEILSLNEKLSQYPVYTFTADVALAKAIQSEVGTHKYILFPSQYICLLGQLGFTPDARAFGDLLPELPVGIGHNRYYVSDRDHAQAAKTAAHLNNAHRPSHVVRHATRKISHDQGTPMGADTPSTWRR